MSARRPPIRAPLLATLLLFAGTISATAQARPVEGLSASPGDTTVLAPVVREADPRGFVVVAVPVPTQLRGGPVAYQVSTAPSVSLLSARSGVVAANGPASVLLTFGVPADAAAGPLEAARTTFSSEGKIVTVAVPVTLEISRVREVRLDAPPTVTGLYPGARPEVTLRLTNAGNLPDTVVVETDAPDGWEMGDGDVRMVLPVGRPQPVTLRLDVPETTGIGDFFLNVRVRDPASPDSLAGAVVRMNVGERSAVLAMPGASVRAALALVGGTGRESGGSALQLDAQGPLAGGWSIDGRATILAGPSTTTAVRGLARVGTYVTSPTVRLWSASSSLTAGNVQFPGGELTGATAYGRGFSAQHRTGSLGSFDLMAARAQIGAAEDEGLLMGVRHSAEWRGFGLSTTAATLEAERGRLDAFGADLTTPTLATNSAELGLAWRDHGEGAGLGWRAAARHSREDRHLEVHAMHAPGGSRAFAVARDRFGGAASLRILPRWSMGGDFLVSRDENTVLSAVESRSWSIFQQLSPRPMTTLRLELRSGGFEGRGDAVAFGTEELALNAGMSSLRGAWFYSLNGSLARLVRSVDQEPLGHVVNRGAQIGTSATAGWAGTEGRVQLELRHQRTDPGMGYLAQQLTLGLSADRIRASVAELPVTLNGSVLHTSWGGGGSGATVIRGGAAVPLTDDMEAGVGFERNPFFRTASGAASWVFSVRLERRATLPRFGLGSSDGFVFQDLDGDGRKDEGEPGMPNVSVRRGGLIARTDAAGAYRFAQPAEGEVLLDVGTLPVGWLLGSEGGGADIAVVPTSTVRIDLELVPSPIFAIRPPDLGSVDVLLVDRAGREWLGRRAGEGAVFFDALPAGEYTLLVDASRANEQLRPADGDVTFRVDGGSPTTLRVPLVGRPIRIGGAGS